MKTTNKIPTSEDSVMDVRPIPCSIKHKLILERWRDLRVGSHFILLNDHDPVPLYYQFSAQWPGLFRWEHLQRGPEEFRVKITKLGEIPETVPPLMASLPMLHVEAGR